METITISGADAIAVARAANRVPSVLIGNAWVEAKSLAHATRMCSADPTTVRLQAPVRPLIEDIVKSSFAKDLSNAELVALAFSHANLSDVLNIIAKAIRRT